jgi:MoaA/NifB/PqqE/SkfB family radical SAM enzyme
MCNIWKQHNESELQIDEIKKMLNDPLFKTIEYVILTGGEPTLRRDLGEITALLVKYCPNLKSFNLSTNGLSPNDVVMSCKKILEVCEGTKIDFGCTVSLDGLNEFHDKVRGVENAFKRATKTLILLKELQKTEKFILGTEAVATKYNIENFYSLREWLIENKLECHFSLAVFLKRNKNKELDFMLEGKNLQQYIDFLEFLRKKGEWNSIYQMFCKFFTQNKKRKNLCAWAVEAISINPNGNMSYCTDSKTLGNIHDKTPSEIYYNKENLRYRKTLPKTLCYNCLQTCFMETTLLKQPLAYMKFKLNV